MGGSTATTPSRSRCPVSSSSPCSSSRASELERRDRTRAGSGRFRSCSGPPTTLRFAALALAGAFAACTPDSEGTSGPERASRPPNIVVLFTDDLGYGDLSSYGHPLIRTPALDRMAAEGQRWTSFYAPAPVCSPSRASLLTGRLGVRNGMYGKRLGVLFPNDETGLPEAEVTLAELLRGVGYRTGMVGKWHLGDQPDTFPTRHGFESWFGIPYSNDMDWEIGFSFDETLAASLRGDTDALVQDRELKRDAYAEPKLDYWNVPLWSSTISGDGTHRDEIVERPTDQRTVTRRYTEEALRFIDEAAEEPFFLYLAYTMPHTPLFRSAEFEGRSRAGRYGDVIEEIDGSVGQILDRLRSLGLEGDTLVVFTSDNGPWLTMNQNGGTAGLLRMGKGSTFEGGMRVPGIFWWPGTIAPGVVQDIGMANDVFATAAALAGVDAPADQPLDSVDLGPLLRGESDTPPRRQVPYYRGGELYAWRSGPWKLHLILEGAYGQPPERTVLETPELYHLEIDPSERFDVAAENPEVVQRLLGEIAAHRASFTTALPLFDRRLAALQ